MKPKLTKSAKIIKTNQIMKNIPLLVACSSTPKNEKLEKELQLLGFNMFIETPVSNENIEQIIEILEQREENIKLI